MYAFIDAHRAVYGVEPICAVLQIAHSWYHRYLLQQEDGSRQSARAQLDAWLQSAMKRSITQHHEMTVVKSIWN